MISTQDVIMAYRFILGREPESGAVVEHHRSLHPSLEALRASFLDSPEFQTQGRRRLSTPADMGPPMQIDLDLDSSSLDRMFARIEQSWRALGQTEPYWSVLSHENYKSDKFREKADEFYKSGEHDVKRLCAWLLRNNIDPGRIHSCCEYGCGVGRVTGWLAARFPAVIGCDISESHLQIAKQRASDQRWSNVTFRQIENRAALSQLEPVDLVLSIIVLQHNPPPVIEHMIRKLLQALKPRGVAFFQVPTYFAAYKFDAKKYLSSRTPTSSFEMHVLPQSSVFKAVKDQGCIVLEVQPDSCVGRADWVSNTFLVQRV